MAKTASGKALVLALAAVFLTAGSALPASKVPFAMTTGGVTSQPIGHYEFCQSNPSECRKIGGEQAAPKITDFGWSLIRQINADVNRDIMPITDEELFGRDEVWAYPKDAGDCEDFVLLKRRDLMQKGFSASALLITVVRKPDGEGHAVLTIRTAGGDYILDNLTSEILPWYKTPYTFLKRQASFDPGRWVKIETGQEVLVGALQ